MVFNKMVTVTPTQTIEGHNKTFDDAPSLRVKQTLLHAALHATEQNNLNIKENIIF